MIINIRENIINYDKVQEGDFVTVDENLYMIVQDDNSYKYRLLNLQSYCVQTGEYDTIEEALRDIYGVIHVIPKDRATLEIVK